MTTIVSKADILKAIHEDHAVWEDLLATIPDARKTEPGLAGGWSVKDLIAHISTFERWTIEWLEPALEGKPPVWSDPDYDGTLELDEQNRRIYERNRGRPLNEVQREASEVHERMLAAIERIPEDIVAADIREFSRPVSNYYAAGTTVWQAIDANAAEHYRHHTGDVRRWLSIQDPGSVNAQNA